MKIYTKTGDEGTTFSEGQTRRKSHPAVIIQGELDEVNAWIGAIRSQVIRADELKKVQEDLLEIGAQLNSTPKNFKQRITQESIDLLEKKMDEMEGTLPPLTNFILPNGPSQIHVARCVCRRAERSAVEFLYETDWIENPNRIKKFELVIPYLNRLSDYLFVLARFVVNNSGEYNEEVWNYKG